jgi:tetratricopeptide (TPR) repeat protein
MYFEPTATNLKFARNASKHALSLDRGLAQAHAARGLSVALSERYAEAEAAFEEAIRLDPSLFEAHYFYARTCFAQGKYAEACRLYEAAAKVNTDEAQALTLLGFTYRTMGEERRAREASARAQVRLERMLDLTPEDPRANYLLADALLQAGKVDEAISRAERAASLAPDDSYTLYGLACIYSRLGRVDDGIAALQRAVDKGFGHKAWVVNDSDFDALRGDPRFEHLVETLPTTASS